MRMESWGRHWSRSLERFSQVRVLVVGDVIHDVFIWGEVRRISPEAPVPVVEVRRETSLLGGAANVVNNVVALGAGAALAGVIGRDAAGEAVLARLERLGVDHSCLLRSRRRPTPVKTRIIAHQQQVVRFDREEKRPLRPLTFRRLWQAVASHLDHFNAVIVSDYAKGTISRELMVRMRDECRQRKLLLAVDPKPEHADWYEGVSLLTPNAQEAGAIAGFPLETEAEVERAGRIILERLGPRMVLITRGEKGMSLFRPGAATVHIPAQAREVFDVTGAGDTVIAAFTVALAAGMEPPPAARTANLAAGIVVGKLGTSVATRAELRAAAGEKKK